MKFTIRRNSYTLEDINGAMDIKFCNLAGAHTNSPYDDPDKEPQHCITIWIDDEEIAKQLIDEDFLVGKQVDNYHANPETGEKPYGERWFIKFVAYPKMKMNPRTGVEEQEPKVMLKSPAKIERLMEDQFKNIDMAYIEKIDIAFRKWKWNANKPAAAPINELWCELDATAGGRNDFDDDSLEQKWTGLPETDEEDLPFK